MSRPLLVLAGTRRLADSMAHEPNKPTLVTIVQAMDETALREALQSQLEIVQEFQDEKR